MVRRVLVIGAGASGLVCIKTCLDEGLEPVCFESSDDIGGLWRFEESQSESERTSIYRSLVTNTSKEMMCFSDFPMPADYPNYLHNAQLLQYYRLYADHFGLRRHIRFQTFLSTRKGAWVVGRMSSGGLPLDMIAISRFTNTLKNLLPKRLINWASERVLNQKYDHRLYGLMPRKRILDGGVLINDDLPGRILQGGLVMKTNLCGFTASGLVFEDGTVEEDIDAVVFCTGYRAVFPFLPLSLSDGPGGELSLYKRVFPPSLEPPTLAIMGLFRTKGPIMPIVEMQVRWALKVFTSSCHLAIKERMLCVIDSERRIFMGSYLSRTYPSHHSNPQDAALQVEYIPYLDSMAQEIGVRPNILCLFLTDPKLGLKVFLGPCTPYQYRLTGPGRWNGARQAVLTQWDRVEQPFRTRAVQEPESSNCGALSLWLLSGAAMLICGVSWWSLE
ncbi:dimethylaniline monooxygenase [N-oxide-forming] 5 isoform X8 [Gadus morhua]|uniref:dimethylaniline monooxygenase [N-oxide-forming] 5 isoform X8 n=1 Tax=Gadus morhua TaxID=8049 RepID=UPI0011B7D978|nr:dimethylaniline monooxygenase [N-oxide-forming] 5-like isoform X8 [Gadus morhua]